MDFRSDTVTLPTPEMKQSMFDAALGDDVYGDDPTVNTLEQFAAERHGFEAALFTSSGTQANLLALMSHCERGDEYLCGQQAHNYRFEAGGAAVLGSIQPQPLENEADGSICLERIKQAIKPNDFHFANTKLLSLENTIGGKVLSLEYLAKARALCDEHGLMLHLDGARVYNAAVAQNVDIREIVKHFDSFTICLSKGLGAPIGSLLLGNKAFIEKARRLRKMLGGGMRQAGMLAAAGLYALQHHVERLNEDHQNAQYLAEKLERVPGFKPCKHTVQTNIVFVEVEPHIDLFTIAEQLKRKGINITPGYQGCRLVTHLGIEQADIDTFITELSRITQV
ncbi:low-specificity L-threonine aldolase [Pseudoalteromonas sp. McH1-7]|uniref:Threonine aldolase n=1 Tax=Pseudoalteromonas peptidolytica F12-50-A1 TaxID=1315280 RepID=A0A8I0T5F4_9GAMM|nr:MULTISPECIES: low-specificity L-threonine aldolase [Pseudoalteromonas]MBE0348406.1 threonine aldolase [Pseudoalteromonas peptidolytica F12-50-A1]MDW7549159.1 low-specificity L-threonine aldolase [Pseudoalteromonas peptidolytica]NLR15004.1 low-specificity L-threonine aldolase [Pseudoalteromonas peptidolytica]NUZ09959.1 low-specificity L-threonine aldolase [Pseudoalteromonas sp. McH1-7]USD30970.1 low-specificity L-threonine aldolase [Pseudoalteromonas sp. SCSIO 43201]